MTDPTPQKKKVTSEIRERIASYVVAAFGFVAGLAWNDAIRTLIDTLFPLRKDTLIVKFLYATLVTIVVVIISMIILRVMKKNSTDESKK